MADMQKHRKKVKHFHEPGDLHELTFSCYGRRPLLTSDRWRKMLSESLDRGLEGHQFKLVAFVFMPEHVHLLVYPTVPEPDFDLLLSAIKRPFSFRVKQQLIEVGSPLLQDLTIRERPGKMTFRFWQEGPGYDRNLSSEKAILAAIDYIHLNPVRRGLCLRAIEWKWSSARYYICEPRLLDEDLPKIHGLPPEVLSVG